MSDDDLTILGEVRYGAVSAADRFGIRRADRRAHFYAQGKTQTGKSTLLEQMIVQDIQNGEGVALLDPHGDIAERILATIPSWRADDLCYFNAADLSYPIGLNILNGHDPERWHLVISGVVSAFAAIWGLSFKETPQLLYILRNAIATLLYVPDATLLHVKRLLVDDVYRMLVVDHLPDRTLRAYWKSEFAARGKAETAKSIAPVLNKVGEWDTTPFMRNIIGQAHNKFDPRFAMDHRRIFIANLSKGKIGEENANLLGSLLVARFLFAATARADMLEGERADFYLYADEFQNFATSSFASILSEARKYRLCLSLFHQYEEQLSAAMRAAVFGNVGSAIAFRVGPDDAAHLTKVFDKEIS